MIANSSSSPSRASADDAARTREEKERERETGSFSLFPLFDRGPCIPPPSAPPPPDAGLSPFVCSADGASEGGRVSPVFY